MDRKLTKADLVRAIASNAGLRKDEAEKALEALSQKIRDVLVAGDANVIVGLGTFKVSRQSDPAKVQAARKLATELRSADVSEADEKVKALVQMSAEA